MITKLEFDMSIPEDRTSLDNALKADVLADKIETLYDEVFRPYFKYDNSFIDIPDTLEGSFKLAGWDESGIDKEMWIDVKSARVVEYRVLEAVWQKVNEHFKGEE